MERKWFFSWIVLIRFCISVWFIFPCSSCCFKMSAESWQYDPWVIIVFNDYDLISFYFTGKIVTIIKISCLENNLSKIFCDKAGFTATLPIKYENFFRCYDFVHIIDRFWETWFYFLTNKDFQSQSINIYN